MISESAGKLRGSREAGLKGDIGDALSERCFHERGGPFQVHTLHVAVKVSRVTP